MFDLIIIGGGPGGYGAAEYAAQKGLSVALIERSRLGGTCLNCGCVPTKAYLHAAEIAREIASSQPDGTTAHDRTAMLQKKNQIVDTLVSGIVSLLKTEKVAVYEGQGTILTGSPPFSVRVTDATGNVEVLDAQNILIATGSAPARLPVPGCESPDVWTSDELLGDAGAEPFQSLLIVGGGVIGVETAMIYSRLGVAVTILEAEKRCLPMMDPELGRSVEALLRSLGVTLLTDARLQGIVRRSDGFAATYEKAGVPVEALSERVMLATGRRPVTDGLLADGVSLGMNRRFIAVDGQFQTNLVGVYAIGDVNGLHQLAHAAHAQGIAAVSHMLNIPSPIDTALIPGCVYTTPEIATVGLSQDEAKAKGLSVVIGKALTTSNARTLIENLGRGFIKLVFDRDTRKLLGAQLFCGRATDLIGELTVAIANGLTASDLLLPLRPHPTFEESITDAVLAAKFER